MDFQELKTVVCAIMVTAYAGIAIFADVILLIVKMMYYIIESTFRLCCPAEEKSVAGEVVLVTGAGHGIGRELALKYASLGAKIVCWDLNEKSNKETADEIKKVHEVPVFTYKCDVTNRDEVIRVAGNVRKDVGDVTILVNNAGIMPCHTFLNHTPEEIRKIFDVNVLAHFWRLDFAVACDVTQYLRSTVLPSDGAADNYVQQNNMAAEMLQAFLPSMIENNHGHIVALSSMAGLSGLPNLVPYCGSKFAVRGLMEALQLELRETMAPKTSNIKFTCIFPYMVDTGLCKKPKFRFPSILSLVSPSQAAAEIVKAQRRDLQEFTIPSAFLYIVNICRNLPDKASLLVRDFLDSGVEAE